MRGVYSDFDRLRARTGAFVITGGKMDYFNGPAVTETEILGEFVAKGVPLNKLGMMAYQAALRRGLPVGRIETVDSLRAHAYAQAKVVREKVMDLIAR